MPVAVNWWVNPAGTLGFAGATVIDCRTAAVTDTVALPAGTWGLPEARAEIVAVPGPSALISPLELTLAISAVALQFTPLLRVTALPSE